MEIRTDPAKLKPLIIGNKVFRSSYDYELSLEDVERARKDLNETEVVRNTCLRDLKEMLSKDGVKYRMDDAHLLCFLRFRKFKCKEAYEKIRRFYSIRREHPEVFSTLPSNYEELLNLNMFTFLPYRDEEGSIILVDKFAKWDPHKLTMYDLLQIYQPIADIMSMSPSSQINKIIGIMDFEGTHLGMAPAAFSTMRFWTNAMQNINPRRVKYVILLNCNSLVLALLKTVRYFLKKKIAKRIVIIGSDMSELHEYINPAILPMEYGGSLENSESCITNHIMSNLPFIKYQYSILNS